MQGIKAMDSVLSKVAFSVPYAWVTFLGMFPMLLYSSNVSLLISDYLVDPVSSVLKPIGLKETLLTLAGLGLIKAVTNKSQKSMQQLKQSFDRSLESPQILDHQQIRSCRTLFGR